LLTPIPQTLVCPHARLLAPVSVPMPALVYAYANVFACANVSACSHACTHAHANAHVPIPNACVRADANTIFQYLCLRFTLLYIMYRFWVFFITT